MRTLAPIGAQKDMAPHAQRQFIIDHELFVLVVKCAHEMPERLIVELATVYYRKLNALLHVKRSNVDACRIGRAMVHVFFTVQKFTIICPMAMMNIR